MGLVGTFRPVKASPIWTLSVLIASLAPAFAVVDTGVVLDSHIVNSNHIQLRLSCEPDVTYVLQSTSDFQNWSPVLTNSDPEALRSFDLETNNAQTFYRVSRRPLSLFGAAVVALTAIDLNGYSITSDSYDSADPNYSINGLYPVGQTNMIKSNGDIMAGSGIVDSVGVGNAFLEGKVRTSPAGSVAVGTNGFVTGGFYYNFNVVFPQVKAPSANWVPASPPYTPAIMFNGDFFLISSSTNLYVGSNVNCRILITSNVSLTRFHIDDGATVKVYMIGALFKISGDGIVNDNGNAASLYYFGLPSNTSIQLGANDDFVGAIYAPQASLILGGDGDPHDFIGASVTKSVKMNGHFNFHYDENLKRIGPFR